MTDQPTTTPRRLRTKIEILKERLSVARDAVHDLEHELAAYKALPTGGGPACFTCGHEFITDYDFWNHYVVLDERLLNIGECPTRHGQA